MIKNQRFFLYWSPLYQKTPKDTEHVTKSYLPKIKSAQKKLQPELQTNNNCVVMLTAILTEPDWINVPCDDKISDITVCQKILNYTAKKRDSSHNSSLTDIWCKEGHLFIKNKCILFKQHKKLVDFDKIIFYQYEMNKEQSNYINWHHTDNSFLSEYFSLIQHHFLQPLQFTLPDLSQKTLNFYTAVQSSTYGEYHWVSKITNETISHHDGYLLFSYSSDQIKVLSDLFHCTDGSYIHETLVCNGIDDCSTGTDEKNCICSNSLLSFGSRCKHNCNNEKCVCSDYFYQCSSILKCIPYIFVCDGHKDCQDGEDEFCNVNFIKFGGEFQLPSNNETFKCKLSGISIHMSFVNDLIPNCPGSSEDELQYHNLLTLPYHHFVACNSNYELPCVPGHSHCFPLSKICIYDLDHNSLQLKYCKNGAHLYNCTNFYCPGHFKCSLSYCVPFDLVCNNIWDCPGGLDEQNCVAHSCSHLFKCKNQSKCLHFSKVCDRIKNCAFGDDELSCVSGYSVSCPLHCFCFAQSIVCDHLMYVQRLKLWDFIKYLKCYNCMFDFNEFHFSILPNLKFLDIKDHFSTHICISKDINNPTFSALRKLDMSFNKINMIKSNCFESLLSLNTLYLSNNKIVFVENKAFHNLRNLKLLDLSYNQIKKISEKKFIGLHNIRTINLSINLITCICPNTFSSLSKNTVHSLNKQVCCMSGPWLKCEIKIDPLINCNELLSNKAVSLVCFSVGIVIILFNSISILIHIKCYSQLQTNKCFTLCLSMVDWLYGVYLLIISSADWYYRGYYAGAAINWKQSFVCHTSSFISLVFFISSPVTLFVMSLARFCVIQWPMTSKFKCEMFNTKITFSFVLSILTTCFIITVTFIIAFDNQIPSRICLLLHDKGQQSEFISFISLLVIFIQIICLLSNITLTVSFIFALMGNNTYTMPDSFKKEKKYKKIVTHLLIVIVNNMCCWIPSTVVFILPLVGYQLSSIFLMWIIITVIPINSVINPILFSILTPTTVRLFSGLCNRYRKSYN